MLLPELYLLWTNVFRQRWATHLPPSESLPGWKREREKRRIFPRLFIWAGIYIYQTPILKANREVFKITRSNQTVTDLICTAELADNLIVLLPMIFQSQVSRKPCKSRQVRQFHVCSYACSPAFRKQCVPVWWFLWYGSRQILDISLVWGIR